MGALLSRRTLAASALLIAAAAALALLVARADATGTTLYVSPSGPKSGLCTQAVPCNFVYAIETVATNGDTVQFEPGQVYDFNPSGTDSIIQVGEGITLQGTPGQPLPAIVQTAPYSGSCNCPTMELGGSSSEPDVLRDLEVEQPASGTDGSTDGGGALAISQGDTVERAVLTGVNDGMYFSDSSPTVPGIVRDSLILATGLNGVAVGAENAGTGESELEGDTVIASGADGIGIEALTDDNGEPASVTATNTIAQGGELDLYAESDSNTSAMITTHYSDFRPYPHSEALDFSSGTATLATTDHSLSATPLFASASNYHEAADSPTIGAGTTVGLTGLNALDDAPRLTGSVTDIGAYEYQAPTATATPSVTSTVLGNAITFTGAATDANPGAGTPSYSWHFDDGTTATGAVVSHTFTTTGAHSATLTVSDGSPYSATANASVTVVAAPITAASPAITDASLKLQQPKSAKGNSKAKPFGAKLSFMLNSSASVNATITKLLKGKRIKGRCESVLLKASAAKKTACPTSKAFESFTLSGVSGANMATFPSNGASKHLPTGQYRLTLTAVSGGISSPAVTITFTVK
ncbi:MAG: PKD domain-containing protein [Solirubrobacteraceae bacterium]